MNKLERLTTQYVDSEDRIRVSGEPASGDVLAIWLTRRLLDRLISHLVLWLEQQSGDLPQRDMLMGFAQQAAWSQLAPQPPVALSQESEQWLVTSVDLSPGQEQLQLVFKGTRGQEAVISFAPLALRQWLGIVHDAYQAAGWPDNPWPEWIGGDNALPGQVSVWH